jgi:hypothetical protein
MFTSNKALWSRLLRTFPRVQPTWLHVYLADVLWALTKRLARFAVDLVVTKLSYVYV